MTEPAAPAPAPAPAVTRNPSSMILGVLGAVLIVLGSFMNLIADIPETSGMDAPIEVLWSTELSGGEVLFFASVGFVLIVVGLLTLVGAMMARPIWMISGGILGVLVYVLIAITFMRVDIGFGDFGLGLWSVLVGGVLAIVAGVMGRQTAAVPPPA